MSKKDKEPPKYPEIGARLAQFIAESGEPNARQFALRAGLTPQLVSHLAAGNSIPGGETLMALATAYKGFDANWLLTGKGGRALTPAAAVPVGTQEPEPPSSSLLPATVRRKVHTPIMSADPDLSHLTPEQRADYWKRRHDRLLAEQAQQYESEIHQETLQLINFTSASSNAAALFATVDALAFHYPLVSAEALDGVRSLPRFEPTPRVIEMRPAVGFQW